MASRGSTIRVSRVFAISALLIAMLVTSPVQAGGTALRLEIQGAIGPATSDYIVKGIEHAAISGATLVIIEMDTPGGLDSAMRDMIKAILNSPVPVATFVSPSGSDLPAVCEPYCRDGTGHQSRFRDTGADWRWQPAVESI